MSEQEEAVTAWGPKNKKIVTANKIPEEGKSIIPGLRHILFGIFIIAFVAPILELLVIIPYLIHKNPSLTSNPNALTSQATSFLTSNVVALLGGLILTWIGLTIPIFWAGRRFAGGWRKMVGWSFSWKTDIKIALIFTISARLLEALINNILKFVHVDSEKLSNGALLTSSGSKWIPILAIGASIGAPIAEELFFRGLVLSVTKRKFGKLVGVIVSATLFGLSHIQGTVAGSIYMFFSTFILGVALAWLVLKTNRLGTSILSHGAFNASAGIMALLGI